MCVPLNTFQSGLKVAKRCWLKGGRSSCVWHCLTKFNKTWQEARSQRPLPSFVFFGPIGKQDGGPGLWLAETFSTSHQKTLNGFQQKLARRQDLIILYQVCIFRANQKNKMPALASLWLAKTFFDFSKTTDRNLTKLDRKQDLYFLFQVCVFDR